MQYSLGKGPFWNLQKQLFAGVFLNWVFLKISQYSQKNTGVGVSKKLLHRCFPVNIANFLRATFFIEHLWWLLLDFLHNLLKITVKSFLSRVFLKNYFLVLAAAFLKITLFRSFCLSLNMSEAYLEPSYTSRWSLWRK